MITITLLDGSQFSALTARGAVAAWRNKCRSASHQSVAGFMRATAHRAHEWCECPVRTDSAANFLSDLAACSLLRMEKN